MSKGPERLLPFVQRTTRQLKFKTNVDGTLEPDTQSALADNNFYKTSDYLLQKRENPSKTPVRVKL